MIRLRPMRPCDRAAVDAMQRDMFPPENGNGLAKLDEGQWWIALDGDRPAGFCAIKITSDGAGYLSRAGVVKAYRGCGLQKRMIRLRLAWARRKGLRHVVTDTTGNPPSANSLISCGFKLYDPAYPWAWKHTLYWIIHL